jgi:hypothetical protein
MTGIPDDIMRTARETFENLPLGHEQGSIEGIANAILAERERCAARCEKIGFPDVAHDLRNPQ